MSDYPKMIFTDKIFKGAKTIFGKSVFYRIVENKEEIEQALKDGFRETVDDVKETVKTVKEVVEPKKTKKKTKKKV